MAGGRLLMKRLLWIPLVAAVCFVLLLLLADGQWTEFIVPSFVFAVGAVYFGMTSLSLAVGVREADVLAVKELMLDLCGDLKSLTRLESGLAVACERSRERITRFSVVAGVLWGVLFWFVGAHVFSPGLSLEVVSRGLSLSIVGAVVLFLVIVVGTCHSAALRSVHQTIDFALLEAKSAVESRQ